MQTNYDLARELDSKDHDVLPLVVASAASNAAPFVAMLALRAHILPTSDADRV